MAAIKDTPGPDGAGAGVTSNPYEKLREQYSTADEAIAILRQAQAVVAGMAAAADRLQASIAREVAK